MKYSKWALVLLVLAAGMSMAGCAHTGRVAGEGRPEVQVDRGEYIHRESGEGQTLQEVQSTTIDRFIQKYNEVQTSEDAKIKGNYKVYQHKDNPNTYYVFSEGNNKDSDKGAIAIQLNSEGNEVVMASAGVSGSPNLNTKLKVANAVIDVMKSREYIPKEQLARIARLQAEVRNTKEVISDSVNQFNARISALDTSLPDINSLPERDPLPEFNPELFDPFGAKQKQ